MSVERAGFELLYDIKWDRVALVLAFLSGVTLTLIGLRFLFQPVDAATFFGVSRDQPGMSLHYAVAFRDVWLGMIAIAFALLKDWRGLTIWLFFGAVVCFADAWIAASSSGRWLSVTFHIASGFFCVALGGLCLLRCRELADESDKSAEPD